MTDLEKEYCVKALNRLLQINKTVISLKEAGVNIETFSERLSNMLEESVSILLCEKDESRFDEILYQVQNWLSNNRFYGKYLAHDSRIFVREILMHISNNPF